MERVLRNCGKLQYLSLTGGRRSALQLADFHIADIQSKDVKTITTTSEPEQSFLTRQLDLLQKDTTKDPRQSFRTLPSSTSTNTTNATTGGVVGPMGNTGLGLNLPGVEKAMLEMEGSGLTGEELKEKFARLGRRVRLLGGK